MGQNMWGYRCALAAIASLALATPLRAEDDAASESSPSPARKGPHCKPRPNDASRRRSIRRSAAPLDFIEHAAQRRRAGPLRRLQNTDRNRHGRPRCRRQQPGCRGLDRHRQCHASLRLRTDAARAQARGDLTYIIDKEVLMITTQEEAEKRLQTSRLSRR